MPQLKPLAFLVVTLFQSWACTNTPDKSSGDAASSPVSGSGSDMYYEYSITSSGKNMNIQGYSKLYLSSNGDARSEMDMTNTAVKTKKSSSIIVIGHADKPNESISVDDDTKTYSINQFNRDSLQQTEKIQSSVIKAGEETIGGFHCVHARIISVKSLGSFYKTNDTTDLWKSDEVPLQSAFKKEMDKVEGRTGNFMYSPDVVAQLKQMGCDGFMVKLEMHTDNAAMKEELVKAEHRQFPKSLFEIPSGYKKTDN